MEYHTEKIMMEIVTYLESLDSLPTLAKCQVKEVILGSIDLSRFGKIKTEHLNSWANEVIKLNMLPILEWDILMTENVFHESIELLKDIDLTLFKSIRVQDPGAIHFVKTNFPEIKIQLILETGNHNLLAVLDWADYCGDKLDRIILSIELPYETLKNYLFVLHEKNIKVEILGLGRILLFYTPRSLLAPLIFDHDDDNRTKILSKETNEYLERLASSEESPHKGFPVLETKHGTFMFHIKEHCLITQIPKLNEMSLDYLRIDLRFGKSVSLLNEVSHLISHFSEDKAQQFKLIYPTDTMIGFFNINKTDTLFTKLKNQKILRQDKNYLGDVYEIIKDKHIAFMNRSSRINVTPNMRLKIVNPEGKEMIMTISWLKNSKLEMSQSISQGELAFINYLGKVVPKSQVYLIE